MKIASVGKFGKVEVANEGYWGINAVKGRKYILSFGRKPMDTRERYVLLYKTKPGQPRMPLLKWRVN
ncbi:MAG: hypothetical protein ACLT63_03945 [Bacteroides xylanisolvens]